MQPEIAAYYDQWDEAGRLFRAEGQLELVRTQEICLRYLPPAPAVVLDVGGGPGIYAEWLSGLGYEVHLIDPVARHVEQARSRNLASASVGDACALDWPAESVDAALLLGPLYHLTERTARVQAWREAARVLRPGGVAIGAVISRFASYLEALRGARLANTAFMDIVRLDLADGQHRNETGNIEYFTTAYLHRPEEVATEIVDAGLAHGATLAVEGAAWLVPEFDRLWNTERERVLEVLRLTEADPGLLGTSAHLIAIARK
jgi:SAM-dependent methyltransferase